MLKVAIHIIIYLALALLGLGLGAIMTGNTKRTYKYYSADESVSIYDKMLVVEEVARQYQPILLEPRDQKPALPLAMWWEAIPTEQEVVMVYHPVWEDEFHPNPVIHNLYYLYRGIVYGFPVRDIEFIQINIERQTGDISRVRFEGSAAEVYNSSISEHTSAVITRQIDGYIMQITHSNSETRIEQVNLNGPRLKFGIATWSHQLIFLDTTNNYHTQELIFPLEYLTDSKYVTHKLARRSQGDFAMQESLASRFFRYTIAFFFVLLPLLITRLLYKGKQRTKTS